MPARSASTDANSAIHADPQQIEQVLINLIRNALEVLTETPEPRLLLLSAAR